VEISIEKVHLWNFTLKENMYNAAMILVNDQVEEPLKKDYINHDIQKELKYGVVFSDFIENTIIRKRKRMGDSYMSNYHTLIYHLNNFCKKNDCVIYTNSVNETFLDDFISYLQEENLKQGYIKGILSLAKAMIKKAGNYGYAVDVTWDDVDIESEPSFSIFLSMNEITRIYYYDNLTKKEKRIRDLFILGCLTGMRYSDYSTLATNNFREGYIHKLTQKTKKQVIIPLHDYVREIINRYDGQIEFGLCTQHFNRYIKKICKKVGLRDIISYSYMRGGKIVSETKEKWEMISSHTARRSFATNMYLTQRMTAFQIMSITGHTTEKSFFRYIRIQQEDISKQIAGDIIFRK